MADAEHGPMTTPATTSNTDRFNTLQYVRNVVDSEILSTVRATSAAVLFVLIRHANTTTGHAWPSKAKLQKLLGIDRSTVCRAIQELDRAGLVSVESTTGGRTASGQYQCSRYTLLSGAPVQRMQGGNGCSGALLSGAPVQRNRGTSDTQKNRGRIRQKNLATSAKPSRKAAEVSTHAADDTPVTHGTRTPTAHGTQPLPPMAYKSPRESPTVNPKGASDGFDAFWRAWPAHHRKVAKSQCLAKWERQRLGDRKAEVMAGLDRWKRSPEWAKNSGQFIPAPLVWLNQARWEAPADTTAHADNDEWHEALHRIAPPRAATEEELDMLLGPDRVRTVDP